MKHLSRALFATILAGLALFSAPAMAQTINAQTGTSYTFANTDCGGIVTFSNASAISATLPQASSPSGGGAGAGTFMPPCGIQVANKGVGTLTIATLVSTIAGNATLALQTGQSVTIVSDGANYQAAAGGAGTPSSSFVAATATALVTTSLGDLPVGGHATIQEWLSFKDASGVTRYIPAF